jgi:hypothetical protein
MNAQGESEAVRRGQLTPQELRQILQLQRRPAARIADGRRMALAYFDFSQPNKWPANDNRA